MIIPTKATAPQTTRIRKRVQSVQRALRLLLLFGQETREWGVTELSRSLQLPKTVVFRLLCTMQELGFVEQNPQSQKYRLGRSVFEIAVVYAGQSDLIGIADHFLRSLVAETQRTAQLGVLDGTMNLSLIVVPSPLMVRVNIRPGDRKPAHATATGKVLLAGLTDDAVRRLYPTGTLQVVTPTTLSTVDQLISQLDEIRAQGYSLNCEESTEGITGTASPVRDYQGRTVAGLSLSWPTQLVPQSEAAGLIQKVVLAAKEMSQRLGSSLPLY